MWQVWQVVWVWQVSLRSESQEHEAPHCHSAGGCFDVFPAWRCDEGSQYSSRALQHGQVDRKPKPALSRVDATGKCKTSPATWPYTCWQGRAGGPFAHSVHMHRKITTPSEPPLKHTLARTLFLLKFRSCPPQPEPQRAAARSRRPGPASKGRKRSGWRKVKAKICG